MTIVWETEVRASCDCGKKWALSARGTGSTGQWNAVSAEVEAHDHKRSLPGFGL